MSFKNLISLVILISVPIITMAQSRAIEADKLHKAINSGDMENVKKMIKKGIDVNYQYNGRNALHVACKKGSVDMVKLIIDAGADVNSITDDGTGLTSLQWITWGFGFERSVEMVKLLLENGADPNIAKNNYKYPLFYSIDNKDLEIVKLLVAHGAKTDIKNKSGQTPVEYISAKLSEKSTNQESKEVYEQIISVLSK